MRMRRRTGGLVGVAVAMALVLPAPVFAAGSGGGGGGDSGSGGEGSGDTTGSDYSDLVRILRAENGTPLLRKYVVPATAETEATTEYCVQPVSFERQPGLVETTNPVDGATVYRIPLQGEWIGSTEPLPVEEITACDPQPQYAMFVSEVELERLNMARTADSVLEDKLAAVQTKLLLAGEDIALDPAGRITPAGVPIDAAPEQAAIYQSLMETGTIPGLPTDMTSPTRVGPESTTGTNSQFDAWELAAAAVGTAASKGVPVNIDTIEYYNQVIGFPPDDAYTSDWGVSFVRSADPDQAGIEMPSGRRYVDYSGFAYNRSQTFPGSVTWLDVADLEWQVTPILQAVPFTNPGIGAETLHGVQAFAQLADDTRAVISYLHEHEVVLPGFSMDPVGIDTTAAQEAAVRDPAVDLGSLPEDVFATQPFDVTASLFNPHAATVPEDGGRLIDQARLRITVHPQEGTLATGQVVATAEDGQDLPFTQQGDDLVGWWGPETGFPVPPGYHVSTTFHVTVADGAPVGPYDVTLELVDVGQDNQVLADDSGTTRVHANEATLLWGGEVPAFATQGSYVAVPLRVYSPSGGSGEIELTVTGPTDGALSAADVAAYGTSEDGTEMVVLPLTADPDGRVTTSWRVPLVAGYTDLVWYLVVAPGAPEGGYALGATLAGANTLDPVLVAMTAPETHGESTSVAVKITVDALGTDPAFTLTAVPDTVTGTFQCRLGKDGADAPWEDCGTAPSGEWSATDLGPGSYEFSARLKLGSARMSELASVSWVVSDETGGDTTAPTLTLTAVGVPGESATFALTSDDPTATFECRLLQDGTVVEAWATCATDASYDALEAGAYVLEARATDAAGNVSDLVTRGWTVASGAPTAPDTSVVGGPRDGAWVLGRAAVFRLASPAPDVRFRVSVNGRAATTCTSGTCRVTGLPRGTNRIRFAALAQGLVDRTPVVRTVFVPRGVLALGHNRDWRIQNADGHLFGRYAQTRTHHRELTLWAPRIKRVALVVSTGPGFGKVHVYLGQRRLTRTPVRLDTATRHGRTLVPVKTFRTAQTGRLRIVVVSRHRTVRIEGLAVAPR